jgi:hypothetical protein
MTDQLLKLRLNDDAELALSTLGADDRRRVENLIQQLRHGREDEFVRFHSMAMATMPHHFVLKTRDWLVFFELKEGEVVVLSVMRSDALRAVHGVSPE